MKIILSIGIPAYNRVSHLKRLIGYYCSEIDESLSDIVEVIVSNDCSPDSTKDYLDSINPIPKWLIIRHNPINLGSHGNMKQIINVARGDYIWLPGDDDYLKRGLISKIINIISDNSDLSCIFLSKLGFNEKTYEVDKYMKRHKVKKDLSYSVPYSSIISLLKENFGDLKFQGSTIVRLSIAHVCDEEIKKYTKDTQDDCYSLFRALRALQSGQSYFISDVCILNGNEISWGDKVIQYLFISDVEFVDGLSEFDISKKDCKRIINRLLGTSYLGLLTNRLLFQKWRDLGKPGLRFSAFFSTLFLSIRRVLCKLHLSDYYYHVHVDISDFGIMEKKDYEERTIGITD